MSLLKALPNLILETLQQHGQPLGSKRISELLPKTWSWSQVADALSDMTREGTLRKMPGGGEYVYELSHAARKQVARNTRAAGISPVIRGALVSTAVKADSALDAYVQRLADPTLAALVDTSRTMWRTCAVAGVQAP